MPPIRVPTKQPDGQSTTVDVQPSDPPWTSARDLIRAALASWPKQDRGELGAADEDETTWALLGWERRTAKEKQEDEDEPRHWNDLLPLDAPLPEQLPSNLSLVVNSTLLKISFKSTPSVSDGSTLVILAAPWTSASDLIEDVCERLGLMRRFTLGGETSTRGRDKWGGGGERIVYGLEKVWKNEAGSEESEPVELQDVLQLPSSDHPSDPTYRFCIPETWMLRDPQHPRHTSKADASASTPTDEDNTVKKGTSATADENAASPVESSPQDAVSGCGSGSGKRYSLFGSILNSFIAPSASEAEPAPAPPSQTAQLKKRKGVDRLSVSEPLAAGNDIAGGVKGSTEDTGDEVEEVIEEQDWDALFDRYGISNPEAQAQMRKLPANKVAAMFAETRRSTPPSLSRASTSPLDRRASTNVPPSSFRGFELPTRLEPQRTGDSTGSKRFSLSSLAGWGEAEEEPLQPLAKQDTGGWSSWWSGGGKTAGKDQYLVSAVKDLSLSTHTDLKVRSTLGRLSRTLASATKEICEEFIDLRGIEAIRKILGRLVSPPCQETGELAFQSAVEILGIIQSAMKFGGTSHAAVVQDKELMMYLALAFTVPSFQVGIRTSRLLSGFVLIGNADAVLDAFTDARHVSLDRYRFQKVVDGLGSKEEWDGSDSEYVVDDHRFALLMFVVTLAREVKEVERRVLLREEFNRAGLKEQIVALRYQQPPDRIVDIIEAWADDTKDDEDALVLFERAQLEKRLVEGSNGQVLSVGNRMRQLSATLRDADELAPSVDQILGSVLDIANQDTDSYTKDTILEVLKVCAQHVADLVDSSDWRSALKNIAATLADTDDDTYPAEHKEDVDLLRAENGVLQKKLDEVSASLKDKEIEEAVFKELPAKVSESFGSSANLTRPDTGEAIAHHGLITRLIQKEKDISELRKEVDKLIASGASVPESKDSDDKAKRDRDRSRVVSLTAELESMRKKLKQVEFDLASSQKLVNTMQRSLEIVHARFKSHTVRTSPSDPPPTPAASLQPEFISTEIVESLTKKEEEIQALRAEVDALRQQLSARKRISRAPSSQDEKDFKTRVAPPPPPPPPSVLRQPSWPATVVSECPIPPKSVSQASASPNGPTASEPVPHPSTPAADTSKPTPPTSPDDSSLRNARAAMFSAIQSRKSADNSSETTSTSSTAPSAPAKDPRLALMAAIQGKAARVSSSQPVSSPSPTPTPSTIESEPVRPAPSPSPSPDPRAALMAALRSRPQEISTKVPGSPPAPPPASLPTPSTSTPPDVKVSPPSESTDGPSPMDLRKALMAGIRNGALPKTGAAPSETTSAAPSARPLPNTPSKKLKPFFWKKLAPSDVQATIWKDMPTEILSLDLVELEQTFSMAPAKGPATKTSPSRKPQAITFLDITRSNNIGILLAKLKLPIPKISQAILVFDDDTLGLDDLKSLSRLLPTAEEMSRISAFEDLSKLAKPDLYFKEIARIPRLQVRLECMLFRRRVELDLQETTPDLEKLSSATQELRSSARFKKVLQIVLCIGNALNTSTFRGGASGFAMEALLKLRETRTARSDCPTLLHFVARTIVKTSPSLALFIEDMPSVSAAARISVLSVNQSISSIANGLSKVTSEIDTTRNSTSSLPSDRFVPVMQTFAARVSDPVERLQKLGKKVNEDLSGVLAYFGEMTEGPEATRPEDFFGMVLTFSMSLQSAAAEVTKHLAPKPPSPLQKKTNSLSLSNPQPTKPLNPHQPRTPTLPSPNGRGGPPTANPGELDAAIRSLHGGNRREPTVRDRPLSRMFVDGNAGGTAKGLASERQREGEGTLKADQAGRRSLGSMFVE